MDPAKVKAVADWPTPDSRRAVQRFLGFANFDRRFIRNFSQVALPLTDLTSTKKRFCWSSQAKIHPCAFFSHRLTLTERNYDIRNRELLAVKLALEEWRDWLEGAGSPFIVWTDHKNLEYICTAKRLNSRQARWALFLGHFRFIISYHPGSKNGKPDALSQIFEAKAQGSTPPVAILQPEGVVAAVTRGVESKVCKTLHDTTVPRESAVHARVSLNPAVQGAFSAPLVVLSFRQLVVWAISANRAAGMHGLRADSLPPVCHGTEWKPVEK